MHDFPGFPGPVRTPIIRSVLQNIDNHDIHCIFSPALPCDMILEYGSIRINPNSLLGHIY